LRLPFIHSEPSTRPGCCFVLLRPLAPHRATVRAGIEAGIATGRVTVSLRFDATPSATPFGAPQPPAVPAVLRLTVCPVPGLSGRNRSSGRSRFVGLAGSFRPSTHRVARRRPRGNAVGAAASEVTAPSCPASAYVVNCPHLVVFKCCPWPVGVLLDQDVVAPRRHVRPVPAEQASSIPTSAVAPICAGTARGVILSACQLPRAGPAPTGAANRQPRALHTFAVQFCVQGSAGSAYARPIRNHAATSSAGDRDAQRNRGGTARMPLREN